MSKETSLGLLLVDDEASILRALYRVFSRFDYEIFTANNGFEGLAILEKERIAVVVSDMRMPEMDGAQFLTKVASLYPETQRIILSGQTDAQNVMNLINTAGVFRYIHKPWDSEELVSSVSAAAETARIKYLPKSTQPLHKPKFHNISSPNFEASNNTEEKTTNQREKNTDFKKITPPSKKADSINETKSRFLATMSHEMRSPLNAVTVMNTLLLETDLSEEQRELTKIALNGGQILLDLINNILDFSKIQSGNLKLINEWFNIIELTENIIELMACQTVEKDVEIMSVIYPDTPIFLFGDQNRVRQSLMNIINNAVKFTDTGGIIVKIKPLKEGPGVEIITEDTGIGISKNEQEVIFNEFVQADNSESRSYGGTGLGLSICRELIILMGGEITLDSELGKGSRFHIHLPLQSQNPAYNTKKENPEHLVCIETKNETLISGSKKQLQLFNRKVIRLSDIKDIDTNYTSFTFIVDIDNDKSPPSNYESKLRSCLKENNPELAKKDWRVVGLISNDGIGKLQKLKSFGFKSLLRKPVRLSSLAKHIIHDSESYNLTNLHREEYHKKIFSNKENEPQSSDKPHNPSYKILLVEDSLANQAIVKTILEMENKNILIDIANNGEEAIKSVQSNKYDAILMDVSMPIMDGITATQKIRSTENINQNTTIIAMTAKTFAEEREQCFTAGMNDYLSKPIDIKKFIKCLFSWLEKTAVSKEPTIEQKTAKEDVITHTQMDQYVLIDPATLEQLTRDTSREALPEILEIYYTECKKRIPQMQTLYQKADWQELSDQAHALKSSSGSFGAKRLQEVAKKIERFAIDHRAEELEHDIQTLASLSSKTITALQQYCQNI